MSNSKSGFELITDILGMAMGLLETNRDQVTNSFFSIPDEERVNGEKAPVVTITTDEVIKTAQELYTFVNEK